MRVLIIDNNLHPSSWGAESLRRSAREFPGVEVEVRRGPNGDFPKELGRYDRIILSGSATSAMEDGPWIFKFHEWIRSCVDLGKPILGICFGHQSLARALGGKDTVRRCAKPEVGWSEITLLKESRLTAGLPQNFYSYSVHEDEVCALPPGGKLLAKSELCEIQAFEIEGKPIFGIQFHPEKNLSEAEKSLKKNHTGTRHLLRPHDGRSLYSERVGQTLFGNFLK